VTEYVEGGKLQNFLRDNKSSKEEHLTAMQQIKNLLDKMGKCRITHGDLKHTNILTQLSQLGDENTIFKKLFPHSVSLFPKTLSNLAW